MIEIASQRRASTPSGGGKLAVGRRRASPEGALRSPERHLPDLDVRILSADEDRDAFPFRLIRDPDLDEAPLVA